MKFASRDASGRRLHERDRSSADRSTTADQFALDVQYYLAQDPRQLPSRYLYDALGSALFEAICTLPWYPLMRAELRLVEAHAPEILGPDVTTIIELGPGSGEKLAAVLAATRSRPSPVELHIVDVSASALAHARRTLESFAGVRLVSHETTYEVGLDEFGTAPRGTGRALALFLGSNVGNYDPPGREAFLRSVRTALKPGDALLLGADLIKPERDLLLAYDDPLGVTAAFNRNLLVRINRELGGNFDLHGFAHQARWNRATLRVEMHLVSRRTQHVAIRAAQLDFTMREGESIWTESSYKFTPAGIRSTLERCGFSAREQWVDERNPFALTLAEAV